MPKAIYVRGYEEFLREVYLEQGEEGLNAALALVAAIEGKDGVKNETC